MWQSFDDVNKLAQDWADSSAKSLASVSKGVQAIAAEAADYSKRSFEAGSQTYEKIVSAGSLEKAVELQLEHGRKAYEAFVAEAARLGELYADVAKDAYRPYESLLARSR